MALQRAITALIAAALAFSLTACGGASKHVGRTPNLALACQTMACTCSAKTGSIFEKKRAAEILWRANGDAYCPEGFVLDPVRKRP